MAVNLLPSPWRCTITTKTNTARKDTLFGKLDLAVKSSKKGPAISYLISEEETKGLDLIDLAEKCHKEQKLCSFGIARKVALNTPQLADRFSEKQFRQSDCELLCAAFRTIIPKGDALLVNANGMYAEKVAPEHFATLLEWKMSDVREAMVSQYRADADRLTKLMG